MSLFDRLADHITPLALIYLLGAMAAAGWLGIAVMLLRDYLADAWYWARRRYLAARGDAFADEPHPLAGWPTDVSNDTPAAEQPYYRLSIAENRDFAAIAAELAGDFQHIDIAQLQSFYLVPGRRD